MQEQRQKMKAAVEAILFAAGDSVEASRLAQALECSENLIHELILEMTEEYESSGRGLRIRRLDRSYQMCTAREYYDVLIRIAAIPRKAQLTDVLMETLSIIAYKQPVTKMEIEKIRGVKSDHAVNKLVEYELVTELGRKDAPGRPILFGTSENFLRHFGVDEVGNLPQIDPLKKADMESEAEAEAKAVLERKTQDQKDKK